MAEDTRKLIFQLQLNSASTKKEIDDLKKLQKGLNTENKEGQIEYQKLETDIKRLSDAYRTNQADIQRNIKLTDESIGRNNQLKLQIVALTKEYDSLSKEELKSAKGLELQAKIKGMSDELKANKAAIGDNRLEVGNYGKALESLPSPIAGFVNGIKTAITAAKAFIATPLGLVLGGIALAIAAVREAFTSSEEGQDKYAKIMTVINAIMGNFSDVLAGLGDAIISVFENPKQAMQDFAKLVKENIVNRFEGLVELVPQLGKAISLLFKGEFSAAGEVATNAMGKVSLGVNNVVGKIKDGVTATKEFIAEQQREAKLAAEVADKRDKADDLERELIVEKAKAEVEIAALRLKSRQEDKFSAEERRKALIAASDLEEQILRRENEVFKLRASAQKLENTFSRTNEENKIKEAQLTAAVIKQEAIITDARTKAQKQLNTLNNEIAAGIKKISAEGEKAAKEEKDKKDKELEDARKLKEEELKLGKFFNNEKEKTRKKDFDAFVKELTEATALKDEYLNTQVENEIQREKDKQEIVKENTALSEAEKQAIIEASEKKITEIKNIQFNQRLSAAQGAFASLSQLEEAFGTKTKVGASAQALIQTYLGATSAYASLASIPVAGPALGAVAAGLAIASGLANVAKINGVQFYDGGYTQKGNPREVATNLGVKPYTYHKNEYVVPNKVLSTPEGARHVQLLETMRTGRGVSHTGIRGYFDGGFASRSATDSVDAQIQQREDLINVISQQKIFVAVEDINTGQQSVSVIDSRNTI